MRRICTQPSLAPAYTYESGIFRRLESTRPLTQIHMEGEGRGTGGEGEWDGGRGTWPRPSQERRQKPLRRLYGGIRDRRASGGAGATEIIQPSALLSPELNTPTLAISQSENACFFTHLLLDITNSDICPFYLKPDILVFLLS